MNPRRLSRLVTWCITASLLLSATFGIMVCDRASANSGGTGTGVDGTGIGIAVLDSGMDIDHVSFLDRNYVRRVAFSKDFTGENRIDDPYGHGTHVTSIAAGNGRLANAAYLGIAPNSQIINLRVLNSQGAGSVSGVLNALDWVMTNRAT